VFYWNLAIYLIVSDKKQRIYIHDNGYWMVKGRFEKASAKDSKIAWDVEGEDFNLSILAVISLILWCNSIDLIFYFIDLF